MFGLRRHVLTSTCKSVKVTRVAFSGTRNSVSTIKGYLKNIEKNEITHSIEKKEYESGRRQLAQIMGYDPAHFSPEQVNDAIEYLLPSSLFTKRARPTFKEPHLVLPPQKKLQCDVNGRPFNSFFYTTNQNFFKIMHETVYKLEELKLQIDRSYFEKTPVKLPPDGTCFTSDDWVTKSELMEMINETLTDSQYEQWLVLVKRLSEHPLSYMAEEFLQRFRVRHNDAISDTEFPEPCVDLVTNQKYIRAFGQKKNAFAEATLYMPGTGGFTVNGKRLLEVFSELGNREQIMFPLQQTNTLGKVDVIATVDGVGSSSLANALRLALARCLASMLPVDQGKNRLTVTGLLTQDDRFAERKQPGQKKARKKPIWKAR
ncbi:unnamed protein product [Trichobilharzia szidati]|nr:unnamed protein product [Trichobilharzia szidati]